MDCTDQNASLRLKYFIRVRNIGDRISPVVTEHTTGRSVSWYSGKTLPHLVGVGSLLSGASPQSYIWGTGLMAPKFGLPNVDVRKVLALRGKLTYQELSRHCGALPDVPLGDPGFLVPDDLNIKKQLPTYDLGVIPHYVDWNHPSVEELRKDPTVAVLNVQSNSEDFLRLLAKCGTVVSSSLHGLIFAEAMGVPNLWVEFSDKVAGAGFKFHDWFSICENAQKELVSADRPVAAASLSSLCELREAKISKSDLRDSLRNIDLGPALTKGKTYSVRQCRDKSTPIFVISYNRGKYLHRVLQSYQNLNRSVEIIVHDNGSTEPQTLDLLTSLEKKGVTVKRNGPITHAHELNSVSKTIEEYFSHRSEPSNYVVTDCDVDLSTARVDALDIYEDLLNRFRAVACVGPMLRIHDIPEQYPLYACVLNRHIKAFWNKTPELYKRPQEMVAFQFTTIDTTFALYRAGETFRRLQKAIRVYEPFEARHLDWYPNEETNDDYKNNSSAEISHWGNSERTVHLAGDELKHSHYTIVRCRKDGTLETVIQSVRGATK